MGLLKGIFKIGKGLVSKGLKVAAPQASVFARSGLGIVKKFAKRHARKVVAGAAAGIAGGAVAAKKFARTPGGRAVMAGGAGAAAMAAMTGEDEKPRRRRINPANIKAMRRSMRRVEQGAKLFSRLFRMRHGSIHGAPKVAFKGKRRAA